MERLRRSRLRALYPEEGRCWDLYTGFVGIFMKGILVAVQFAGGSMFVFSCGARGSLSSRCVMMCASCVVACAAHPIFSRPEWAAYFDSWDLMVRVADRAYDVCGACVLCMFHLVLCPIRFWCISAWLAGWLTCCLLLCGVSAEGGCDVGWAGCTSCKGQLGICRLLHTQP